jgi:hypothetical protein
MKIALAILALAISLNMAHAQTYTTYGSNTYGSDGSTYSTTGNAQSGYTTYGTDGQGNSHTCSTTGNTTYCN